MKRFSAILLILALIVSLALPVGAAILEARITPTLSFSGSTANCRVAVHGDPGDEIDVTVKLYYNNVVVGTWSDSGEQSLTVSGSCRANSGLTYTMKSTVYINGVRQSVSDITRTCP